MKKFSFIRTIAPDDNGGSGMVTMQVVAEQSVIDWKAFKTGGGHEGSLKIKSGIVEVDQSDKRPVGGTIYFDMNTIDDFDQAGMLKNKLIEDLKKPDFFDVEKYPEAKLEIIKVDHTPDADGNYGVNAALTMKGVRNEITFKANYKVQSDGSILIQTGTIIVDRIKWGITVGSKNIFKKLADHIIADNFDVKATVVVK